MNRRFALIQVLFSLVALAAVVWWASKQESPELPSTRGELAALVGAIALFAVLGHPWSIRPAPLNVPTTERIGERLFSTYVLPFEIASLLLTAAMIGAIVIARED